MTTPIDNAINVSAQPVVVGHMATGEASDIGLLGQLRLTAEDLAALRRQGAVQVERRGKKSIGKLRFRRGGKQVVRYIGGATAARQVQEELTKWQAAHRKSRELLRLAATARTALRGSKKALAPHLEQIGYRFHGLAIRRRREPPANGISQSVFTD
jgi:hypothetical protein